MSSFESYHPNSVNIESNCCFGVVDVSCVCMCVCVCV